MGAKCGNWNFNFQEWFNRAVVPVARVAFAIGVLGTGYALAQTAPASGILADGNAVGTGFSGLQLPALIRPGTDPVARATINLNGASARVIDLQSPGASAQSQVISAPKRFTFSAGQIGQVFGVAIDAASPPNIYVAATSVYGLPIVVPDADGDGAPDRAEEGTANAFFMPGLFGPRDAGGGPGSIWRIDGATGAVSLFANVTLDGAPNAGPALGGLAFDPISSSLLVADRETGMIHRFDLTGAERGRYDHGMQGRAAGGLAAVPFDPSQRLSIARPPFQPANPETWGYAQASRRVFGLAVQQGRLYYAVAEGLQVWSVAIGPDGAFGNDPRMELAVPPGQSASEISKIAFDTQGRMLLAERIAPSGAFDFVELTEEGGGRVLRYAQTPSATGLAWQADADEYPIGMSATARGGNGGVSIGYGYTARGTLDLRACGGYVWATGEQLRTTSDAALAAQLARGGSQNVNGLQGNGVDFVGLADVPRQSYFVDYDDRFDDPRARGHAGDIAVFQSCTRPAIAQLPPAAQLPPPAAGMPAPPAMPGAFPPPPFPPGPVPPVPPFPPGGAGQAVLPDLGVSKAIQAGPNVPAGVAVLNVCVPTATCWFRITITNHGPGGYTGPLNISDAMPAGWTFISSNAPWACQAAGAGVTCTRPPAPLAAGQSVSLDIQLQPSAPAGGQSVQVQNCAEIDWKGTAGDGNKANDRACHPLVLAVAPGAVANFDLSVAKKGPAKCTAGQTCTFNVVVQNLGTGNYQGPISIEDVSVPGLTLAGPSPSTNWTCNAAGAGKVTCNAGQTNLPSGMGSTMGMLILNLTVPANLPAQTTQIKNCAKVVYGGGKPDANVANDEHCVTIAIEPPAGQPGQQAGQPGQQPGQQQPGQQQPGQQPTPQQPGGGVIVIAPGGILVPGGPITGPGGIAGLPTVPGGVAQPGILTVTDIAITKIGPSSCAPGEDCQFTIRIGGAGSTPYKETFEVADNPPAGWTFVGGGKLGLWNCPTPTNCTYNVTKNPQWPKNGFTSKSANLVTDITFKVPANAKEGMVQNCVTATLPPPAGQTNKVFRGDCVDVWVGHPPKLTVEKKFDNETCAPGESCDITITVKNEGKGKYTGFLDLHDQSVGPYGLAIESVGAVKDWNCGVYLEALKCNKFGMKPGETATFKVKAKIKPDMNTALFNELGNCVSLHVYDPDPSKLSEGDKQYLVRDLLRSNGYDLSTTTTFPGGGTTKKSPWGQGSLSAAEQKMLADYKSKHPGFKDAQGNPDTSGDITDELIKSLLPKVANEFAFPGDCADVKIREPRLTLHKAMDKPAGWQTGKPKCFQNEVCTWTIEVYGTEAVPYTKPIKVEERLPEGFKLVDYAPKGPGGWACSGQPTKLLCTHAPANVTNNKSLKLTIRALLTFVDGNNIYGWNQRHPWVVNCAKIIYDDPKQYAAQTEPDRPFEVCDKERLSEGLDFSNIDYDATGSGPCTPPKCSFYEFTVTGRERVGTGPLTQRITLPAGSDFPQARVTKAPALCPVARWSCSKSGDAFTCAIDECRLAPGEQVTLRLDGNVAPELKEPPPAPIEKIACGVLEYETNTYDTGIEQLTGKRTKQACATILVLAKPPVCPAGYTKLPSGDCCLNSQMTADGRCCPAGQKPDARRRACVPVAPPAAPVVAPPPTVAPAPSPVAPAPVPVTPKIVCTGGKQLVGNQCVCPGNTIELRGRCIACTGGKIAVANQCVCPSGTVDRRGICVAPTPVQVIPPQIVCTGGKILSGNQCVCPANMIDLRGQCVACTGGKIAVGNQCVCPSGTVDMRGRCVVPPKPQPTPQVIQPTLKPVQPQAVQPQIRPQVTPQQLRIICPAGTVWSEPNKKCLPILR